IFFFTEFLAFFFFIALIFSDIPKCSLFDSLGFYQEGIESHRLAEFEYTKKQGTRHLYSAIIFKV
ncbi:unnamed protein product, partial [Prunus brigantina]